MTGVTWHTASTGEEHDTAALWSEATARAWLPADVRRVLLHVAAPGTPLVLETARSLVAFLQRSGTPPRIQTVGTIAPSWPGVEHLDLRAQPSYRVDVACLRDGARVPEAWFDDVCVVTVTDVAPDSRLGFRGVLAAQAGLLDAPGALDLDVAFAAHRLLRSTLCVACGSTTYGDPASETWWAISPDDVALDRAIAWQAGAEADGLPVFRHLARHEAASPSAHHVAEDAPRLRGHVASSGRVAFERLVASAAERSRRVVTDVQLAARNLYRLPQFIERRMPGLARLWRPA